MNSIVECGVRNLVPSVYERDGASAGYAEWKKRNQEKYRTPNSELRTQRSQGFTLLEVLLAMAILAVILTVVYASFSTAGTDVEQAETVREETDAARALMTRLSADISNAYLNAGMGTTFFDGKKEEAESKDEKSSEKVRHDSISMTTLTNWPRPDSKEMELWEVGYFFKEKTDGKGYTLFRREKRELSKDVPALEGGDEYEISDRVNSLHFTYFDGFKWVDNGWSKDLKRLPQMVEITMVLDTGKVYVTKVDLGNNWKP